MKVVFCTPTRDRPHDAWLAAMEASCPVLDAAGIEHKAIFHIGSPYISFAMADMIHRAMQTDAEAVVLLDDDLAWRPGDLVKLITTPGEVVSGSYRFKQDEEEYMGDWERTAAGVPVLRLSDLAIKATMAPSGFLKITRSAIRCMMKAYPELLFGAPEKPAVDLFNHGAIGLGDGRWWGQDYAFCRRWNATGNAIWMVPDLGIDHHAWGKPIVWRGNLHEWLMRRPGGALHGVNQRLSTEKAA